MAEKLNRKSLAKNRSVKYSNLVTGKNAMLKVKTSCSTFGECSVDPETGLVLAIDGMKKCSACPWDVKKACIVKLSPKMTYKEPSKRTTRGSKKPFECGIELWLTGYSKPEIISYLIVEKNMNEKPAIRFTNDIFSVGKAAIGQARKKTGLIARYMNWALYSDQSESAPEGCKVTLGFCKPYAEVFKKMTIV